MLKRVYVFLAVLVLTGCSIDKGASSPSSASSTSSASSFTTPTTTSPAPPASLPMGQTYSNEAGDVTVYAYKPDAAPGAPPPTSPGTGWAAADVQVCVKQANYVNDLPWALVGSDNGRYAPSSTGYGSFPSPKYPMGDTPVAIGECVRGWIVFVVPTGATVAFVRYAPSSGVIPPTRWAVA